MASAIVDGLTGRVFGKWTVLDHRYQCGSKKMARCRCECGLEKNVYIFALLNGRSTHCKGCTNRTHGNTAGDRPTKTYKAWSLMIGRCYRDNGYHVEFYKDRGIEVCDRWRNSFEAFLEDMGEKPAGLTLERLNNDGPYCKENCCWATRKAQANNRRSNRRLTAFGETKTLQQWTEDDRCAVQATTLAKRLSLGWHVERAILTPSRLG